MTTSTDSARGLALERVHEPVTRPYLRGTSGVVAHLQEQVASSERVLPAGVQDALGELAAAAKDGLLALSVGVGLGMLSEMMEAELDEVVGRKHATLRERAAVRHGHEEGEVTLDGRRVARRARPKPVLVAWPSRTPMPPASSANESASAGRS